MAPVNRKILIDAIGILLLALIVVVGYKLSPLLLPKADRVVEPAPGCDLHRGPCSATLPNGGSLQFSIAPRPIPLVSPLALEVTLNGADADAVEVDFAGVDMDMGINRPPMAARGGGRFTGEGSLPVCVTGSMQWQATVLLQSGRERIAVPFRFTSGPAAG